MTKKKWTWHDNQQKLGLEFACQIQKQNSEGRKKKRDHTCNLFLKKCDSRFFSYFFTLLSRFLEVWLGNVKKRRSTHAPILSVESDQSLQHIASL